MLSSTYQSTDRPLLSTLYEPLPKHLISVLGGAGGEGKRGEKQAVRTSGFPASGSSANVARGDSRPTTFRSPGDMSCNVKALDMGPSEAHTDTGRLCSAGSKGVPVPRRLRSYAALRLPASFGHGSGSPCQWPTSLRVLLLCLSGRRHVHPPRVVRRRRVTGSPSRRDRSRRGEGLPGYGAVLFVRAMVEHPAGYHPLLAQKCLQGIVVAFR